jgi:hypothetical protein
MPKQEQTRRKDKTWGFKAIQKTQILSQNWDGESFVRGQTRPQARSWQKNGRLASLPAIRVWAVRPAISPRIMGTGRSPSARPAASFSDTTPRGLVPFFENLESRIRNPSKSMRIESLPNRSDSPSCYFICSSVQGTCNTTRALNPVKIIRGFVKYLCWLDINKKKADSYLQYQTQVCYFEKHATANEILDGHNGWQHHY